MSLWSRVETVTEADLRSRCNCCPETYDLRSPLLLHWAYCGIMLWLAAISLGLDFLPKHIRHVGLRRRHTHWEFVISGMYAIVSIRSLWLQQTECHAVHAARKTRTATTIPDKPRRDGRRRHAGLAAANEKRYRRVSLAAVSAVKVWLRDGPVPAGGIQAKALARHPARQFL